MKKIKTYINTNVKWLVQTPSGRTLDSGDSKRNALSFAEKRTKKTGQPSVILKRHLIVKKRK